MSKTSAIEKNSIVNEFQNVPINDLRLINRLRITAATGASLNRVGNPTFD